MKIRADIAALIRQGHTDAYIANHTGCHRTTAARARRTLGYPPAHHLTRIYAEAIPTGRVKDYRPDGRMPTSPAQQRANRERLMAALRNDAA